MLFTAFLVSISTAVGQSGAVWTYHNDNARTGQNLNEEILTSANVNTNHFGKLWVLNTDGLVDAEPLYAAGVSIPLKGAHNVLFVATEHDSVYAFDADRTNLFWQVSLLGTNEVPSDDRGQSYLTFTVNRSADPPDVTYAVEVSSNLLNGWVSGPPYTVTLTNTAAQLVVRDNTPVPAASARFMRLVITSP